MDLIEKVNQYVENQLNDYHPQQSRAPKVIHDTILGSNLFLPYEIILIDSPIVQRLRNISQVDVAPLIFPSGNHNRFEHTLGVAVIAQKMVDAIWNRVSEEEHGVIVEMGKDYILSHVRFAAILHDCGHSAFSHLTEDVFSQCEDFKELLQKFPKFETVKPHEVLSYLITTSDAMKMFFKTYVITHPECSNIDLNLVGNMIIGYIDKSLKNQAFMVEIINGAFDADKIDYIQRDSHFTGIKMVLDLPRLFYTINIVKKDNYYRLCVDINGVATLEQIIFNKMMLYSTVYHHQKVRAATSLVKGVLNTLRSDAKITLYGKDFKSAADFLELTDNNIYEIAKKDIEFITTEVKSLCNRKLPMRTVAVSAKSIDKRDSFSDLASFLEDNEFSDVETQNILKEAIAEVAKEKNPDILPQDIYIDFPKLPNFKEASTCLIKDTDETITLRKVFPMEDWVKAFSENKYRGYIFTKNEYREDVFESTREVFQEAFQVDLLPLAKALCKF